MESFQLANSSYAGLICDIIFFVNGLVFPALISILVLVQIVLFFKLQNKYKKSILDISILLSALILVSVSVAIISQQSFIQGLMKQCISL